MNYIHLSSSTNSTMFTDCCGIAITNSEKRCPRCNELIYGYNAETEHKRGIIRWEYAFKK